MPNAQTTEMRRLVLPFLATMIAALAAILRFTTASASADGVTENRVGPFNVAGEVLIEPPEHVFAGQHTGRTEESVETAVATDVAQTPPVRPRNQQRQPVLRPATGFRPLPRRLSTR
jgi:hypothetical protein